MKNTRNYIYIFALMLIVAATILFGRSTGIIDDGKMVVALVPNDGFSVTSQNPVVVDKGESISSNQWRYF